MCVYIYIRERYIYIYIYVYIYRRRASRVPQQVNVKKVPFAAVPTFPNVLEGVKNTSRFRDETRSKHPPKKLATPEGNSQLGSNCPNSKAPENSPGGRKADANDARRRASRVPGSLLLLLEKGIQTPMARGRST